MGKKKDQKEYLETVGGKVPPAVRKKAEAIAAARKWTLSKYVCEAVTAAVDRDFKEVVPSTGN